MDILEILKWVGIVLAAGFVGYFGRYLAMLIIERLHKKRSQETPTAGATRDTAPPVTSETAQLEIERQKAKAQKKKDKAKAKRAKKERK